MVLLLQSGDGFPLLIRRRYISYYIAQLSEKNIPDGAIMEYPIDLIALKKKLD